LRAEVASLRAGGNSWEATAQSIGWDADELRRAVRSDPTFDEAYERAEREIDREARAEMIFSLRRLMREPDSAEVRKAADILARFLASEERNRTRTEVEELRAETKLAVAEAKNAAKARKEAARAAEEPVDDCGMTPEEIEADNRRADEVR